MVNRAKLKKHLPNLLVDGPAKGDNPEYQRIRRAIINAPKAQTESLLDRLESALADFDIYYDEKRGFDVKPRKKK
jgi:hypothetical protein